MLPPNPHTELEFLILLIVAILSVILNIILYRYVEEALPDTVHYMMHAKYGQESSPITIYVVTHW